jgi:D-glycero-D-manno-heptose 1,7-bisphosphate phosphatase
MADDSGARGPVAFLDRDGTINRKAPEGDYVKSWDEFELLPRAPEALRLLADAGYRLVVVTNQRGIALGRMSEEDVADIHRRMVDELAGHGVAIEAVYHCPHDTGDCGECDCRKPGTGMLERARRELGGIEPARCVMIGDSASDMEAAERFGCEGVLASPSLWDAAVRLTRR